MGRSMGFETDGVAMYSHAGCALNNCRAPLCHREWCERPLLEFTVQDLHSSKEFFLSLTKSSLEQNPPVIPQIIQLRRKTQSRLVQPLCKTVWRFLKNLKIELPHDPAISLLGPYPKEKKLLSWRNICHCSISFNSQDIETAYVSINGWMDKENVVYIHNEILFHHKKKIKSCHLWKNRWALKELC